MFERLKRLPFMVKMAQKKHPDNSTCYICGLPWAVAEPHVIPMREATESHGGCGFFCVCEHCWERAEKRRVENGFEQLYHQWCDMTHGNPPYELTDMYIAFDKEWDKTHKD